MNAILIDIGNTRIKWRVIVASPPETVDPDASLDPAGRESGGALALSEIDRLAMHWRASVGEEVDEAWLSNVASPDAGEVVEHALAATWPCVRVEHVRPSAERGGVVNGYRDPPALGSDRWLAMIGGHRLVPDRSLLVCSFGTATTIDLVARHDAHDGKVTFVGGLILPGIDAMRGSLVERTARLADRPGRFVDFADDTDDAIASGVIGAQLGAIERAWRAAQARVPSGSDLLCLAGGGAGPAIIPFLSDLGIRVRPVPDLVLRGLAVVARESSIDRTPTR